MEVNKELFEFRGDYRRAPSGNKGTRMHPVHIEFVAIPTSFDIRSHLSIREITGQFMCHDITLDSVMLIASAVKEGPTFTLSSPTGTYAASAIFFIEVLKQLGLTLKAFSNFMPIDAKSYAPILEDSTFKNDRGQPVMDMTFIFINTYKMVEEGVLQPVIEAITKVEDYEQDMELTSMIYNS